MVMLRGAADTRIRMYAASRVTLWQTWILMLASGITRMISITGPLMRVCLATTNKSDGPGNHLPGATFYAPVSFGKSAPAGSQSIVVDSLLRSPP
jgi:hypothetical protein